MSALQRVAAAAVALIALAAVLVLVVVLVDGPIARGPDATPSPTEEPTPTVAATTTPGPSPAVTPSPTVLSDEEVLAVLAEIEEQVVAIRGLPAADIGPADLITRDELGAELQRIFDEEYPEEDRERDNFVLRAFGLLGEEEDVAELQLQLLGDQVLGFYDDTEKRMVVVTDRGLDPEAKLTYAHEYTHALQDAAFGLSSLETDAVGEDDRSLARIALIEGDATTTMLVWALRHLTPEEMMQIGGQPLPDVTGIPSWMVNQLMFPYVYGQQWVMDQALPGGSDPLRPDFRQIDAAYAHPPDSTAQIIDIEKWHDRIRPVEVELPDIAAALGAEWEEVDSSPVGQASAGILLEHFGMPGAGPADPPVTGWAGDRAMVARGPDDAFALVWRLVFEADADASAFEEAYREFVVGELPFEAAVSKTAVGEVTVVHAPTIELLRRTVEAATSG